MPAPPPPAFFLRSDEQVLLRTGAEPGFATAIFLGAFPRVSLAAAAVAAAALFLPFVNDALAWVALAGWIASLVVVALVGRARQRTAEYVVTDRRVYARVGRLITRVHLTTHDRITDIRYRQGPIDRRLGIEGLSIMTAGGDVALLGLGDARAMRETIEGAREALVERLLRDAGVRAPDVGDAAPREGEARADDRPPVPAFDMPTLPSPSFVAPGDRTHWLAKPRPVSALAALRGVAGLAPILAFVYVGRGPEAAGWVALALLGLGFMLVAVRVMQHRRAEYVATDRRMYVRTGLFSTTIAQLTYDKIADITYKQDVFGRALGYGSITLTTAGGAPPVALQGLHEPLAAKEVIERLRSRYLHEEGDRP